MSEQVKSSSSSTSSGEEKARAIQVERAAEADVEKAERLEPAVYNAHIDISDVDERKLLRKLDLWLVPWLSFLYLLSFLDRTSIGNAKVGALEPLSWRMLTSHQLYGLEQDLGINDTQYNIALTIFFFSYSLFEVSAADASSRCSAHAPSGSIQCIPQTSAAIHLAVAAHAALGYHDGAPPHVGLPFTAN